MIWGLKMYLDPRVTRKNPKVPKYGVAINIPRYLTFITKVSCEIYNLEIDFKQEETFYPGNWKLMLIKENDVYKLIKEKI